MLIYHPAFDAFHCAFRLLAVIEAVPRMEIDKARLLDFYLLFPAALTKVKMPQEFRAISKEAASFSNVYHDPIHPLTTFNEMRPIQEAALQCIAAAGLVDLKEYDQGFVSRTTVEIPPELQGKLEEFLAARKILSEFVLTQFAGIQLLGEGGLKHRTQLMEHRYDFV